MQFATTNNMPGRPLYIMTSEVRTLLPLVVYSSVLFWDYSCCVLPLFGILSELEYGHVLGYAVHVNTVNANVLMSSCVNKMQNRK